MLDPQWALEHSLVRHSQVNIHPLRKGCLYLVGIVVCIIIAGRQRDAHKDLKTGGPTTADQLLCGSSRARHTISTQRKRNG